MTHYEKWSASTGTNWEGVGFVTKAFSLDEHLSGIGFALVHP